MCLSELEITIDINKFNERVNIKKVGKLAIGDVSLQCKSKKGKKKDITITQKERKIERKKKERKE